MVVTRSKSRPHIQLPPKNDKDVPTEGGSSKKAGKIKKSAKMASSSPPQGDGEDQRSRRKFHSAKINVNTVVKKNAPRRKLQNESNNDKSAKKVKKDDRLEYKEEEVTMGTDLATIRHAEVKKEESDQWEIFGNTSEEYSGEEETEKRKKGKQKKVHKESQKRLPNEEQLSVNESGLKVRRSGRSHTKKAYTTEKDSTGSSSISSSPDSSENNALSDAAAKSEAGSERASSEDTYSSYDSDESFVAVSEKRSKAPQKGKKGGRSTRQQSTISRVTNTVSKSKQSCCSGASRKSSKMSAMRTRQLTAKPLKPWQRKEETVMEDDIVVPPRTLRRGEKKMLQFRVLAASLALGRSYEMSMEECCKVMDEIRNQSVTVKAAVASAMGVPKNQNDDNESSSEDEWEEMEPLDADEATGKDVQVTLEKEEEKDWWALYLRQEVNKCVRENWENAHKVNILCCIAHLQYLRKIALEENLLPSLMLTVMPSGYQDFVGGSISLENASRVAKWFRSAFKPSHDTIKYDTGTCRFDATARLAEMVPQSVFENDADRAVVIPRRWDEKVIKAVTAARGKAAAVPSMTPKTEKQKFKEVKKRSSMSTATAEYLGMVRNYWIEYWDHKQKRWICVDPLRGSVDEPNSVEENLTKPVIYVFAVDNEGGVREVTARYASEFLRPDFRRQRTDPQWLANTLRKKIIRPNIKRSELEDLHMRQELVNKPLPTTLTEYKNHPLYVLEKDLLKFEGIYPKPENQKPLGEVRGHKVYPRSTVFTLQSANNWIKMARSVKEGEKPYKVVKARPNIRIPVEEREQRYLDVFGYWQTEPYRPPKVENGRIPRNEYGNVYMYQSSMCPIGAVHLRLPGLPSIARRLGGLECVPAVIGWDFNSCSNFPIIEGACVLEKDAQAFINEWKKLEATREERENKKREERVLANWRKLIRGISRLHYVKKKFGATKEKARSKKKKVVERKETAVEAVVNTVIDRTVMAPRQIFTHDDLMRLKHP